MSDKFSGQDVAIIRLLYELGYKVHRIAALFDCNQGRISELVTGERQPLAKKGKRLEIVE